MDPFQWQQDVEDWFARTTLETYLRAHPELAKPPTEDE